MWIRTQDRKGLVDIVDISLESREGNFVLYGYPINNYDCRIILGKFDSKEKALKVLDGIQTQLKIGDWCCRIPSNEEVEELIEECYNSEFREGSEDFIVKPQKGKVYSVGELKKEQVMYYIDQEGRICRHCFGLHDKKYYRDLIEQGNVFYDEKSAREEIKRRKVYHIVEKYAHKFSKEEWEDEYTKKWFPCYDHEEKRIEFDFNVDYQGNGAYFKSTENIQEAIDEVGEDDFIKYYLGVEL